MQCAMPSTRHFVKMTAPSDVRHLNLQLEAAAKEPHSWQAGWACPCHLEGPQLEGRFLRDARQRVQRRPEGKAAAAGVLAVAAAALQLLAAPVLRVLQWTVKVAAVVGLLGSNS